MSIIDKIRAIFQSFRNRNNPRLDEGNFEVEHTPRNANREEFVRNLQYTDRSSQSAPLVDRRRELVKSTSQMLDEQRRPNPRRYTTNRARRLEAQRQARKRRLQLGIAGISTFALAASCLAFCTQKTYGDMSLQEIENVLTSKELSNKDLQEISDALEDDGLDIIKGKIADATGLDSDNKDSLIKIFAADSNAPTTIVTPSETFRSTQGVGVYDNDRNSIISDGITAVVDSTALVQDESNPLDRNLLKRYAKLLKECDESFVYVTPNTYAGNIISADNDHEAILTELSIADKNEISLENNFDSGEEMDL